MPTKAQQCAEQLLSVAPQLMQTLRVEMRAGRASELTVPQFRTLVFFQCHDGGALSQAAEHLGLALPAASKLVETLVLRGLLTRAYSTQDRRRVVIALTGEGSQVLAQAKSAAIAAFTRKLHSLSALELDVVLAVLGSLATILGADAPGPDVSGPEADGQQG